MAKTLCDWSKKEIEREFDRLCAIVAAPRYTCRKCARSASEAKYLCKPRKLPQKARDGGGSASGQPVEPEPSGKKH